MPSWRTRATPDYASGKRLREADFAPELITDLSDGAVTEAKIEDGAVTEDKIGAAAVTAAKLAPTTETTAAALADSANAINTAGKYLGKVVVDEAGIFYLAAGAGATDDWLPIVTDTAIEPTSE